MPLFRGEFRNKKIVSRNQKHRCTLRTEIRQINYITRPFEVTVLSNRSKVIDTTKYMRHRHSTISNQSDLLPSLCRDHDIKLIDAVRWSGEFAGRLVVSVADVGDDAIEDDIAVVDHWTDVFRQTDKERCVVTRTQRACNQ